MRSFEDLIGAAGQRQRDVDAKYLGGLEVQKQFNFGGPLNREISRLVAFEYSTSVSTD